MDDRDSYFIKATTYEREATKYQAESEKQKIELNDLTK
jgi:hypothetical protein